MRNRDDAPIRPTELVPMGPATFALSKVIAREKSALGIVGLRAASPRTGRLVTAVLATSATNDFLQAAFKLVCEKTNEVGARS